MRADSAQWRAAARLLGLGARARNIVVGVEGVRAAALRGNLSLAIVASDVSANSSKKVTPLLGARGVALVVGPAANELGAAVGRRSVAAIGVVNRDLASGLMRVLNGGSDPHSGE